MAGRRKAVPLPHLLRPTRHRVHGERGPQDCKHEWKRECAGRQVDLPRSVGHVRSLQVSCSVAYTAAVLRVRLVTYLGP